MGRDGYTGLVVVAASLFLFWATLGLKPHPMVPIGPGFYPRIVLGLTAFLGAALFAFDVWRRRKGRAARPPETRFNYALVAIAFGVFALYVVALPYLGFRLATFAFLLAMPVVLERPRARRRWIAVILLAVVGTLVIHYSFELHLKVLLPRGRWTGF